MVWRRVNFLASVVALLAVGERAEASVYARLSACPLSGSINSRIAASCDENRHYVASSNGRTSPYKSNAAGGADLATGQLKARATGNAALGPTERMTARFTDSVTILGAISGTVRIPVTLRVEGKITTNFNRASSRLFEATLTDNESVARIGGQSSGAGGLTRTGASSGDYAIDVRSFDPRGILVDITIWHEVTSADRTFDLFAQLSSWAAGWGPTIVDFGSTAQLGLVLPSGLSFASESGVLLTRAPLAQVPEPLAAGLFGIALLAAGSLRRRAISRGWA